MEISKTIKPEENAEVSEMLGYVMGQLKHNGGKWDLTDDAGKPVIFDAEKNVYIPHTDLPENDPDEYCPAHFLQSEVHSCFFPAFPDGFKNEKSSS